MSGNSTLPPPLSLPNPYTLLAWLPPTLAAQFQAAQFVAVAVWSMWCWDWLLSLPQEYKMIVGRRWSLATTLYAVSRLGTMSYLTTSVIFVIAPITHCSPVLKLVMVSYVFSTPFTTSLFFLRIRAVYRDNRVVLAFFFVIWLATMGTSLLVPLQPAVAIHIGTSGVCVGLEASSVDAAPVVANTVLSLLVCLFISWRLGGDGYLAERPTLLSIFRTKGLSPVATTLIQSGQLYYLVTLGVNITHVVLYVKPSVSPVIRAMFSIPSLALDNSMATRVHRMLWANVGPTAVTSPTPRTHTVSYRTPFRSPVNTGVEVNVMTDFHAHDDSVKHPEYPV